MNGNGMATDNEHTDNTDGAIRPGDLSKLLIEYREAAQLDVQHMADALCLTDTSIRALESESFDKLPEPPYVRGYLKNYAKLAHKSPEQIIHVYETLSGTPAHQDLSPRSTSTIQNYEATSPLITPQRFRLGLLFLSLLLLALLTMMPGVKTWMGGLWSRFSTTPETSVATTTNEGTQNLPSLTGELPGNLPISTDQKTDVSSLANTDSTEGSTTSTTETTDSQPSPATTGNPETTDTISANTEAGDTPTEQQGSPDTNEPTETQIDTTTTAEAEEAATEKNTHLKFIFSEEVWLRIRDNNGKTLYEALHPAGTEKELSLNSPLRLRIGNAPALTLFVNGEAMDISTFTKGSIASFGIE